MNKISELIKKYPFEIFMVIVVILNLLMNFNFGDDVEYFNRILSDTTFSGRVQQLIENTKLRYTYWSSRNIIDVICIILCSHTWLFRMLNIFVWGLLYKTIQKISNVENGTLSFFMISTVLIQYPFVKMGETGWISTSVNYLWTVTFGLYALSIVLKNNKLKRDYILGILAAIYASNHEQVAVCMMVLTGCIFVYQFINKKIKIYNLIIFGIGTIELINMMLCPGNAERSIVEQNVAGEAFASYNIIDKAYIGFTYLINHLIETPRPFFILFLILLVFLVWQKKLSLHYKIASIYNLIFVSARYLLANMYDGFSYVFVEMELLKNVSGINLIIQLFMLICSLLMIISIIAIVWKAIENKDDVWKIYAFILAGGICTVAMGFSPSLNTDVHRTLLIFYIAIMISTVIVSKYIKVNSDNYIYGISILNICAILNHIAHVVHLR